MEAGRALRDGLVAAGDAVLAYSADSRTTRTGTELLRRAECLAGALVERGLQGGVVGLYYRNSGAALEAFIATELIGATRLPVEPSAAPAEAKATLVAGHAGAVLTDRHWSGAGLANADTGEAPWFDPVLTLLHDDDSPLEGPRWTGRVDVDPAHPLVLYPRAVTGGVLFQIPTSYGNWQSIIAINQDLYRSGVYGPPLGPDDCYLTVVQLMHVTGMVGSFPFVHLGLPQVLVPRFNAAVVADTIRTRNVTTMFAVPGMLSKLADEIERGDRERLGSLRRVLYGGAPVAADELKRLLRVFGPTLIQLYGRYEAGWPLTVLTQADHEKVLRDDEEVRGSCGRAIDAVELELRPAPGRPRELEIRTRSGMVSPDFADPDGWCNLGDTALITDNGYVHLTGRLDGMINTGSFHVYPQEVEEAILEIPSVTAVSVTGEPDPTWGQTVTAYLVSTDPDIARALREQLRGRLAPYKIPKVVHVVREIPAQTP